MTKMQTGYTKKEEKEVRNKEITSRNLKRVKRLISDVQNITPEESRKMLDAMVQFHSYSLFNQMILAFHGCSQVAGFRKWRELGRTVKKGGKAVWILAPWFKNLEKEDEEEKEEKVISGFFSVPVFDISETEGEEISGSMTQKANIAFAQVKDFAEAEGFRIVFKPLEVIRGGYIQERSITLNNNLTEKDWTGTLIHELAHGLLGQNHKDTPPRVKEQQAEVITYLACRVLGIERKSEFYLKSWGLSQDIIGDFQAIDKVTKQITEGLAPTQKQQASHT